jgi:hypothetical protein
MVKLKRYRQRNQRTYSREFKNDNFSNVQKAVEDNINERFLKVSRVEKDGGHHLGTNISSEDKTFNFSKRPKTTERKLNFNKLVINKGKTVEPKI